MKTLPPKLYVIFLLLVMVACKKDELGERTFYFNVSDGEAPLSNGQTARSAGATIKVYSSAQAWVDGVTPLKTMTVDANGAISTFDKFALGNVVYAENGSLNNWPSFIKYANLNEDPNLKGTLEGGTTVYSSFLSSFEEVSGKSFVLSDVRVNNISVFGNVSVCSKDNFLKLQKNLKLVFNEGTNVCVGQTASQEFDFNFVNPSKLQAIPTTINGISVYEFSIVFPGSNNILYVKTDFTQVLFKGISANQEISIYTKQP